MLKIFKQTYLFVFAHPDDESFYAGGLLAKIKNHGGDTHILLFTHGERGMQHAPDYLRSEYELGKQRKREAKRATNILGVDSLTVLTYPDGQLHAVPVESLSNEILKIQKKIQANHIVTFGREPFYIHRDHLAVEQAVVHTWRIIMNHTSLWKRAFTQEHLAPWHDMRIHSRKKTTAVRSTQAFWHHFQEPNLLIKLSVDEQEKRQRAIMAHASQSPGALAGFLRQVDGSRELYWIEQGNKNTFEASIDLAVQ